MPGMMCSNSRVSVRRERWRIGAITASRLMARSVPRRWQTSGNGRRPPIHQASPGGVLSAIRPKSLTPRSPQHHALHIDVAGALQHELERLRGSVGVANARGPSVANAEPPDTTQAPALCVRGPNPCALAVDANVGWELRRCPPPEVASPEDLQLFGLWARRIARRELGQLDQGRDQTKATPNKGRWPGPGPGWASRRGQDICRATSVRCLQCAVAFRIEIEEDSTHAICRVSPQVYGVLRCDGSLSGGDLALPANHGPLPGDRQRRNGLFDLRRILGLVFLCWLRTSRQQQPNGEASKQMGEAHVRSLSLSWVGENFERAGRPGTPETYRGAQRPWPCSVLSPCVGNGVPALTKDVMLRCSAGSHAWSSSRWSFFEMNAWGIPFA